MTDFEKLSSKQQREEILRLICFISKKIGNDDSEQFALDMMLLTMQKINDDQLGKVFDFLSAVNAQLEANTAEIDDLKNKLTSRITCGTSTSQYHPASR